MYPQYKYYHPQYLPTKVIKKADRRAHREIGGWLKCLRLIVTSVSGIFEVFALNTTNLVTGIIYVRFREWLLIQNLQ